MSKGGKRTIRLREKGGSKNGKSAQPIGPQKGGPSRVNYYREMAIDICYEAKTGEKR